MDNHINGIFLDFILEMAAISAETGGVRFIEDAVNSGLDPNSIIDDETLLYKAAKNGHIEVSSYLLRSGANPNVKCHEFETPLSIACSNGHVDLAKIMIDHGAYL